ncbi:hypothetical protein RUND412_002991 [Rhizina undulata]
MKLDLHRSGPSREVSNAHHEIRRQWASPISIKSKVSRSFRKSRVFKNSSKRSSAILENLENVLGGRGNQSSKDLSAATAKGKNIVEGSAQEKLLHDSAILRKDTGKKMEQEITAEK